MAKDLLTYLLYFKHLARTIRPLNLARLLVIHASYRQTNKSQNFLLLTSLSPASGVSDYEKKNSEMDVSGSSTAVLFPRTI